MEGRNVHCKIYTIFICVRVRVFVVRDVEQNQNIDKVAVRDTDTKTTTNYLLARVMQ